MTDLFNPSELEYFKFKQSPPPEWEMAFDPKFSFRIQHATAPSWFHRLMQRLVLGIRWRRLP